MNHNIPVMLKNHFDKQKIVERVYGERCEKKKYEQQNESNRNNSNTTVSETKLWA